MQQAKKGVKSTAQRTLLQKILCRETVVAFVVVATAIASLFIYFSQKSHVVLTLRPGKSALDSKGNYIGMKLPVKVEIQNLGEGPVNINGLFLGFPNPGTNRNSCEVWATVGDLSSIRDTYTIKPGEVQEIDAEINIPLTSFPSEVCLATWWRDQNEYQRGYVESIGKFETYTIRRLTNNNYDLELSGGIKDVVAIFPSKRCITIFSFQICI